MRADEETGARNGQRHHLLRMMMILIIIMIVFVIITVIIIISSIIIRSRYADVVFHNHMFTQQDSQANTSNRARTALPTPKPRELSFPEPAAVEGQICPVACACFRRANVSMSQIQQAL